MTHTVSVLIVLELEVILVAQNVQCIFFGQDTFIKGTRA